MHNWIILGPNFCPIYDYVSKKLTDTQNNTIRFSGQHTDLEEGHMGRSHSSLVADF